MRTTIYLYLCFMSIMSLPLLTKGQNCKIHIAGKVIDQHDNQPLAFATIYVEEAEMGAITDSLGNFNLYNVCSGTFHFSVSHIGCETSLRYISIKHDTTLIFSMEHHDELLETVEITGFTTSHKTGNVKSSLTGDFLNTLKGKTLAEMLKSMPGMQSIGSGPGISKPVIQGLTGNRIMIFNHGIPQEGQQWGNDHAPELNPDVSDEISVIRGMASVRYGTQAMGGVVIVESKNASYDPHWHGYIRLRGAINGRGWGIHNFIKKSTGIGNVSIHGGFNQSGDHQTPSYFLTNTGNKNQFLTLQLSNIENATTSRKLFYSYYANHIGILRAAHSGNLTDLQEAFTRTVPLYTDSVFQYRIMAPSQKVSHHIIGYRHRTILNDNTVFHLETGLQSDRRKEFDVRRGQRSNIPSLDLLLISGYSDLYVINNIHSLKAEQTLGIQARYRNNTNVPGTGIRPLIPDYINLNSGLYYIFKQNKHKFSWELGMRGEFRTDGIWSLNNSNLIVKSTRNYLNFVSNTGLKYNVGKKLDTYLDISYAQRPPEINELFANGLHQGLGSIEEGNGNLVPEKTWRISNDWQGQIFKNLHIHSTIFYSRIRDFIYLQPSGELRLTIRGAFPVYKYTATPVEMMGLNIRSTSDINSAIQLNTALNLLKTTNLETDFGLPYMPPYHGMVQISYTIGETRYFNECKVAMDANYHARQRNVNPDEDFLPPPGDYLVSNASITIKWKTIRGTSLNTYIQIDNVWNAQYRDYMNRLRYFADELGRNISASLQLGF